MSFPKRIDKKDKPSCTTCVACFSNSLCSSSLRGIFTQMSPFMFSKTCEQRRSLFPNHQDQQPPTTGCPYPPPTTHNPHRRATSEPTNDYYRHKLLPRLPHEIETYRSRSLPELPSEASRRNKRPQSKPAPAILPPDDKNRPLPSPPPPRPSGPAKRGHSTVETICILDSESFFPYWSKIRLLQQWEMVESWREEKLTFARERQGCWTKGKKLFAHEVQDCAIGCACGMS